MLEPVVNTLGYDLVDLDLRVGRNGLLRLFIDHDPPVTLTDCELVSEQIGAFLDVEDPLKASYVLEISSPGEDRRLRTPAHFDRFTGHRVRVDLAVARDGRRRFSGVLTGFHDDCVEVRVDDDDFAFPLRDVAQARLVPGTDRS